MKGTQFKALNHIWREGNQVAYQFMKLSTNMLNVLEWKDLSRGVRGLLKLNKEGIFHIRLL
jgi:hypothetical protein